jgi:hypothetical protein
MTHGFNEQTRAMANRNHQGKCARIEHLHQTVFEGGGLGLIDFYAHWLVSSFLREPQSILGENSDLCRKAVILCSCSVPFGSVIL